MNKYQIQFIDGLSTEVKADDYIMESYGPVITFYYEYQEDGIIKKQDVASVNSSRILYIKKVQ